MVSYCKFILVSLLYTLPLYAADTAVSPPAPLDEMGIALEPASIKMQFFRQSFACLDEQGFASLGLTRRHALTRLISLIEQGNQEVLSLLATDFTGDLPAGAILSPEVVVSCLRHLYKMPYLSLYGGKNVRGGLLKALGYAYGLEIKFYKDFPQGKGIKILHYVPSQVLRKVDLLYTPIDFRRGIVRSYFAPLILIEQQQVSSPLAEQTPPMLIAHQPLLASSSSSLLLPPLNKTVDPVLTVVFDLDETLVYNRNLSGPPKIRPHFATLLQTLQSFSAEIEIVVWTAACEETGRDAISKLENFSSLIDHRIFRHYSWYTSPFHTKDLRRLGRDMQRLLIVENSPNSCKYTPEQALLVEDFTSTSPHFDQTLNKIAEIIRLLIEELKSGGDVAQSLAAFADKQNHLLQRVDHKLPPAWENAELKQFHPLLVPPHGNFYEVSSLDQ